MITPNMPMPTRKLAREQTRMTGSLKRERGMSGSAARVSTKRKATSITAARASRDTTRRELQPYCVTQVSANSRGTRHAIRVTTPHQSMMRRTAWGRNAGNSSQMAAMAITPTGRFTQKHQRQERLSVSHPPRVGPKIDAAPQTEANRP